MPVVPCAQDTIGQPPLGALPFGTVSTAETGTGLPSRPVEVYSSNVLEPPLSAACPVSLRCQIAVPCLDGSFLAYV
jgi:hypothetical protein